MATVNKLAAHLLDPANADLHGQSRVNAEIFTAVEILGRKLERSEAERDRLARRLALIESAATVDEKTGKLYLPVTMDPSLPPRSPESFSPKWMVAASLMSSAIALFSLGLVLFREPVPTLSKEHLALLDSLRGSQFALATPESKSWRRVENNGETSGNPFTAAREEVKPETTATAQLPDAAELARQEQLAELSKPVEVPPVTAATPPETPKIAEEKPVEYTDFLTSGRHAPPAVVAEPKTAENAPVPLVKPERPEDIFIPGEDKLPPKTAEKTLPPKEIPKIAAVPPQSPAMDRKTASALPPAIVDAVDMAPDKALPEKFTQLEKRAYQGIPEAQHDLATLYASGKLVAQNYKRAIFWFIKSADGGVANAHYNLGVIYHQGLGVPADMTRAIGWYEKAAELGHPEAMYNLGIAYIEGIGAKANIAKGVSYFKRAAQAGVAQAAYNLGVLYESNFIGAIDKTKAVEWYQMAANEGHAEARDAISRLKSATSDQALTLADMVEPAAGREFGEGDASAPGDSRPAVRQGSDMLAQIQKILIRQNLLSGQADGIMTPQTEDAIRTFQKRLGLPKDGLPSQSLLKRMQQATTTAAN